MTSFLARKIASIFGQQVKACWRKTMLIINCNDAQLTCDTEVSITKIPNTSDLRNCKNHNVKVSPNAQTVKPNDQILVFKI